MHDVLDLDVKNNLKVGDLVNFGRYFDSNDDELESLKRGVLAIENSQALLITKECIDAKAFHRSKVAINWSQNDIRSWLAQGFIDLAFNSDEKQSILPTRNDNNHGILTKDSVFLLSVDFILASSNFSFFLIF